MIAEDDEMIVNMNVMVRLRLTKKGESVLKVRENAIWLDVFKESSGRITSPVSLGSDIGGGRIEMQLWEAFSIFGDDMVNGGDPLFSANEMEIVGK